MNREYEILNEKLDYMFQEIMWLRNDLAKIEFDRTKKELEYKLEDAKDKLERHKEDARWIMENLDERRKYFESIRNRFPKEEQIEVFRN